jgi:tRNA(Ile)-lysidine synthase
MFIQAVLATLEADALLPRRGPAGRAAADPPREPVIIGVSGGPDSMALAAALCALAGCPEPAAEGSPGAMHDPGATAAPFEAVPAESDAAVQQGCGAQPMPPHPHPLSRKGRGENDASGGGLAIRPIVAHLNHGLRGRAADEDQEFVEAWARARGLACDATRADVRAEAAAACVGLEEAAREARRRFLAAAARRHGATKIALAHQADDRAETILFNILRGTGVEGLAVLGPRSPMIVGEGEPPLEIIRPLIRVTRSQVLAYMAAIGQPFRTDESNASDAHTRNRLRNDLLPAARLLVNPRVDEALVRLGNQATAATAVLDDALAAVWRQIVREVPGTPGERVRGGSPTHRANGQRSRDVTRGSQISAIVIDADDFAPLRPWLQGAILRRAVERLGGGLKLMSADRTHEVVSQLLAKTMAGPVDLPDGLAAERKRRTIRISRRQDSTDGGRS